MHTSNNGTQNTTIKPTIWSQKRGSHKNSSDYWNHIENAGRPDGEGEEVDGRSFKMCGKLTGNWDFDFDFLF